MKKRVLSLFLAFLLCLTLLPTAVFADGGNTVISDGGIVGDSNGEGGGIYVKPGGTTEGGGGTYIPKEGTPTEIWRDTSRRQSVSRSYDGTTNADMIKVTFPFTDGTNEIMLEEGRDCTAVKTFDSAEAGSHTVTVELTLIGDAAVKYKLGEGSEKFTIDGYINKAHPDLTVSLLKTTCTVGEKLLPLLSVEGVKENAEVTYYYTQTKNGYLEFEGTDVVPKIDNTTSISDPDTYYVYAKTAETKNYEGERSDIVELTVTETAVSVLAAEGTKANYTSLPEAMKTARNDDTVRLNEDVTLESRYLDDGFTTDTALEISEKNITLDLNGYVLGSDDVPLTVRSGAALTLINADAEKSEKPLSAGLQAYLLVEKGGSFTCTAGKFRSLELMNDGNGNYDLTLADGVNHCIFGYFLSKDDTVTVNDVLKANHAGMALHASYLGADVMFERSKLLKDLVGQPFYVGACSEHETGADGTCIYCGASFAASVTVGDNVTYYDELGKALRYANQNNGCTLKLLADKEENSLSIEAPFIFDLNGHNVQGLAVCAKATIRDSGTPKGKIGSVLIFDKYEEKNNLTFGDLLDEGYAFRHENGSWAKDSDTVTISALSVTIEEAPIKSVKIYAKDKNNKEAQTTMAYGTTGEVKLVSVCNLSVTSGEKLSCAWYKITDDWAIPPLEGETDTSYTLPADIPAGTHTYRVTFTNNGYSKSAEIVITVTPISLEGAAVTVKNPTYNGKEQKPTVTVTLGDKVLSQDNDYTVDVTKQTDAGSYTLTVRGGGSYTGEIKNVEWKIKPIKIDSVMVSSNISKVYDGTAAITKTAEEWANILTFKTLSAYGTVDAPSYAYTVSDAYFVEKRGEETIRSSDAGEKYGITFKIKLNSSNYVLQNYYDEEPTESKEYTQSGGAKFTITQANVTPLGEITQLVFNDLAKTYTLDLAALLPKLSEGCKYGDIRYQGCNYHFTDNTYLDSSNGISVSKEGILTLPTVSAHTSNVNTPIGTITVPVVTTNYQEFKFTINVVISARIPPNASGVTVSASELTYGQTLNESKLTATGTMKHPGTVEEVKGIFAWTDGTVKPNAGERKAEWTFTPDEPIYASVIGKAVVKVNPKSIEGAVITLEQDSFVYDGTRKDPEVASVVLDGKTLVYGQYNDYGYHYDMASDVGTYNLVVGGNHNYTDSVKVQWSITPREVTPTITVASCTYTGDVLTPTVTLTDDLGNTIDPKEYTVSYSNNINAGSGRVTITDNAGGNYVIKGRSQDFPIDKATAPTAARGSLNVINGTTLTYTYDFSKLLPELSKGEYGTVSYNYVGINSLAQGYNVIDTPSVNGTTGALTLKLESVWSTGQLPPGSVGTVSVRVYTTNFRPFLLELNLNPIDRIKPVQDGIITAAEITYGDELSKSEISGKMKDPESGNTVSGTFAWVTGTVKPDASNGYQAEWTFTPDESYGGIYLAVNGTVDVTVNKATQYGRVSMAGYTYGETPAVPTLTDRTGDTNAQVTYYYSVADSGTPQVWDIDNPPKLNADTYNMFARIGDTNNYYGFEAVYCEFTVAKATPTYTKPTGLQATYGQTLENVTLPNGWSWMDSSESVGDASTSPKTFKAKFESEDTDNYSTVENIELEVTVNKAEGKNLKTVDLKQKYTDTADHTYTPDWSELPEGVTWTYSSESDKMLSKHDFNAAGSLLTYAVSDGKAGDVITIILKASCGNYEDYTVTLNITLTEKDNQAALVIIGNTDVVYGQTLTLSTIGGSGTGDVTYRIDAGTSTGKAAIDPDTGVLTPIMVGSVSVIAVKAGDKDFVDVTSAPFVIMIKPAVPTGDPKYTEITGVGRTLKDAALTTVGSTLKPNDGKLEWVDDNGNTLPDYTTVKANTIYKWRFTPTDTNYTTLTGSVELYHVSPIGGGGWYIGSYNIEATADVGGSISPSGNVSVIEGRSKTFTITPDNGYKVSSVKIDGVSIGAVKSYTFEKVKKSHTIEVSFSKINVFVDVTNDSYYKDAVDWAVENGITQGTDDSHFSPNGICTRAQAVTFLWRTAGSPEPETRTMPFADVPAGSYYYDAVLWAVENGITTGTSDTAFSPDADCTRAQIVTFLWRSEKSPTSGTVNPFTDVKPTAYYADAVLWAVENGITKGTGDTTFSPDADCTRAQIVTFLRRCGK